MAFKLFVTVTYKMMFHK